MSKTKTLFFCQSCGHDAAKWLGKCPSCGAWNSFVEEVVSKGEDKNSWRQESKSKTARPKLLDEIESGSEIRITTHKDKKNRL